ncbi:glycosyltransferase family 39 protein [Inconstantimicrobium mannanitabidum]|uniref:Dolichyl-phosphate-mannose--protein mannosyltransferase n=1 Tax=Inconstantimicrobium mannanitabidum TaxID=1604901 RepID=A0ACB5RDI4_9CLOT|nr:glycosyltransferase family 39 protein [Clostridium sp. TW13]GKX67327.1 dolichyl-phosphate-mannose--protein mannosyltransferase [Clostridium sp. TW13]
MKKVNEVIKNVAYKLKNNYEVLPVIILSIILNFTNLSIEGFANEYYSSGVKSMTMNLKNFFFVSFDPAGFVSIDKPPLGFWLQVLSSKIFGFSGFSVIFPQALAGVISVILLYYIIKRFFGKVAGIISALCLATTPIFVAASRNNTIDNLLVLTSLLACIFISIAAEKGDLKYLLISFIFVGVGFNIKMIQAYMIMPALYITYICSNKISKKKRFINIIIATSVLVLGSLSWTLTVDSISKNDRPYVGSSSNNSVVQLITGHNGTERLKFNILKQRNNQSNINEPNSFNKLSNNKNEEYNITNEITERLEQNKQAGIKSDVGVARLFRNNSLSDQISWLLILALLGAAITATELFLVKSKDNNYKLNLLLWTLCLVPECIYFSYAIDLYHSYYLTMMSVPIAALCGIGLTSMWKIYNKGQKGAFFLPIALMINGGIELLILSYYFNREITKFIFVASALLIFIPSIILVLSRRAGEPMSKAFNIKKVIFCLTVIGTLLPPAVCAATPMVYKMDGSSPMAGLRLISAINDSGKRKQESVKKDYNDNLIKFLSSRGDNEKYFLAVATAPEAAKIMLDSGREVMAIGGYSGNDKIISLDDFKGIVRNGKLKYAMVGKSYNSNKDIEDWIKRNGRMIPREQWISDNPVSNTKFEKNDKLKRITKKTIESDSVELYELNYAD